MKIKFITVNVWHGGRVFENLESFLVKEAPDILCMQEVYDGKDSELEKRFRTLEVLKQKLGFSYSSFAQRLFDSTNNNLPHGNAILSKFPLKEDGFVFFDIPLSYIAVEKLKEALDWPFGIQKVVIEIEGKKVHVLNVHGVWGFDTVDNPRRLSMADKIIEQIPEKESVIIAGDFNMSSQTETIRRIEKHVKNVFGSILKSTFNMKYKKGGGFGSASVDMVFVSNDIQITKRYMPEVDVSDHMPLVVELMI